MPTPIWAMSSPTVPHQQDFGTVSIQLRCDSFPRRIWKKRATGNMENFLRGNSSKAPPFACSTLRAGVLRLFSVKGIQKLESQREK